MDEEQLRRAHCVVDVRLPTSDAARRAGSDVEVWRFIRDLKRAKGDVRTVAAAYGLSLEVALAVRTSYLSDADAIDARIRAESDPRGDTRHAA